MAKEHKRKSIKAGDSKLGKPAKTPAAEVDLNPEDPHERIVKTGLVQPPVDIEASKPSAVSLGDLIQHIKIPPELISILGQKGIHTLEDVRKMGGSLIDLSFPGHQAAFEDLRNYANLGILFDPKASTVLMKKGYTRLSQIAKTPKNTFVDSMKGEFAETEANKVYAQAVGRTILMSNIFAKDINETVDRDKWGDIIDKFGEHDWFFPQADDCGSATSPQAYLADLIGYTLKHVKKGGKALDLKALTDMLQQPFEKVLASYQISKKEISQARLCTETLRRYLKYKNLPASQTKKDNLAKAEKKYLLAAYTNFLEEIGTSYGEVRSAAGADEQARSDLLKRLGVDPGAPGEDRLNQLLLDPEAQASDPHALTENRLENLFGLVSTDTARDPFGGPLPSLLYSWRLEYLRNQWTDEDWLVDVYDEDYLPQVGRLPVIDPDLIGPDDLREPKAGNAGFDLWLKRRQWIDSRHSELRNMKTSMNAEEVPDLPSMVALMSTGTDYEGVSFPVWPAVVSDAYFAELRNHLLTGTELENTLTEIREKLHLSSAAFSRFAEIKSKYDLWRQDSRNSKVLPEEWEDVYSILVQAQKQAVFEKWRNEEASQQVSGLSQRYFWISLSEPVKGEWPPIREAGQPFLDPEVLKESELPDSALGVRSRLMYKNRKQELDDFYNTLKSTREISGSQGLENILKIALGNPPAHSTWVDELEKIQTDLLDSEQSAAAQARISNELGMTEEEFNYLMTVRAKDQPGPGQPEKPPTPAEWAYVYKLLTKVNKIRAMYPEWRQDEDDASPGIRYWEALKARLPQWRADSDSRKAWQEGLRRRGQAPLIDPDLIGKDDLQDPTSGDPYTLWLQRDSEIKQKLDLFKKAKEDAANIPGSSAVSIFEAVLNKNSAGLALPMFADWEDLLKKGVDLSPRLNQFMLTGELLQKLLSVYHLALSNQRILQSEWDDVFSILVQVEKQFLFTQWRKDERARKLLVCPDYFRIPERDFTISPVPPADLPSWRATLESRRQWQDKLQARIDQKQVLAEELESMAGTVEEATLSILREALIEASDAVGVTAVAKADWLTGRLLTDLKISSSQKTTRLAHAIGAIQGLIWSIRTGQLKDSYPDLTLDAVDFDEEWQWLGSYTTWCSAMNVFLYPDNFLYPMLREQKSRTFNDLIQKYEYMTPELARQAMAEYSGYLRDLSSLSLEACLSVTITISKGFDGQHKTSFRTIFTFGRSLLSNKVYWCSRNAGEFVRTMWEEIPCFGSNVTELIGAVAYRPNPKQRFLYLFVKTKPNEQEQLLYAKYDLINDGSWSQQAGTLEIVDTQAPGNKAMTFSARLLMLPEEKPPCLLLAVNGGSSYVSRSLNDKGDAWEKGDFQATTLDGGKVIVLGGWHHLSQIAANAFGFDVEFSNFGAEHILSGDFDGDGRDEIAVVGSSYSGSEISCHAFSYLTVNDFKEKTSTPGEWEWQTVLTQQIVETNVPDGHQVKIRAVSGDFDGDGRDEIFVLHENGTRYVDFNPAENKWNVLETAYKFSFAYGDLVLAGDFYGDGWDNIFLAERRQGESGFYIFNPSSNTWTGQMLSAGATAESTHFAVSGDFDGDGRDEVAIKIRGVDYNGKNSFYVLDYDAPNNIWNDIGFDVNIFSEQKHNAKFMVAGDFDGDGQDEIAIAPDAPGTLGNDFIVMDFEKTTRSWKHLGFFNSIRWADFYADGEADQPNNCPARFAYAGDFDGDGRDEIAVAPDISDSRGNDFWIMDYDPWSERWRQLSRVKAYSEGTSFDCSGSSRPAVDAVSGNFDGDVLNSIAVLAQYGSGLWVMRISAVPVIYQDLFEFTERLSESGLGSRRLLTQEALKANSEANTKYMEEAFYSMPLHLAQKLQEKGEYTVALDWIRTVYDYSRPVNERNIYYDLKVDDSPDAAYQREPDWLLHPLFPHVIAGKRPNAYIRYTITALIRCLLDYADAEFTYDTNESLVRAGALYSTALELFELPVIADYEENNQTLEITLENKTYSYYVLPNPLLKSLHLRAQLNLFKLHSGRNIVGMKRQLEPYSAPMETGSLLTPYADGQLVPPAVTFLRPTPYRFKFLIERAKQLAQLASQTESAMLNAIEKYENEAYTLLKAKQDVKMAQAQVQLQDLRLTEAQDNISLAGEQNEKIKIQQETYEKWIAEGMNTYEKEMIENYKNATKSRKELAEIERTLGELSYFYKGFSFDLLALFAGFFEKFAVYGSGIYAKGAEETKELAEIEEAIQIASVNAGYERRKQEWEYQKKLANQDWIIGEKQKEIVEDHFLVVGQERFIAGIQAEHAEAAVNFLANKFTNTELYSWMSGIFERVYRFFLQQATATAELAASQLAFERHETPPRIIRTDYWEPASDNWTTANADGNNTDRRGLTGSARLLQDIYQLDQYAFETDKRKLQITRTISLAQMFPYEFQRFRETGVITFRTPLNLFDRDYPGHYLRLIKKVRTTVVALIPASYGIKATLTSSGISRIVSGSDVFQTLIVRRDPETVALSSPANSTGLFELESQPEMLLPFESSGVDTIWEFSMPKAANFFDYNTVADVLVAIDYTALNSYEYRQEVIQRSGRSMVNDKAFSFRENLVDQWYDLHNPEQSLNPMVVKFSCLDRDFPPNLEDLKILGVILYLTCDEKKLPGGYQVSLRHNDSKGISCEMNATLSQIIKGGSILAGKSPMGEWELAFPDTQDIRNLFKNEEIEDILFVITYSGRTPEWPA